MPDSTERKTIDRDTDVHRVDRLWRGDRDQGGAWETKEPQGD